MSKPLYEGAGVIAKGDDLQSYREAIDTGIVLFADRTGEEPTTIRVPKSTPQDVLLGIQDAYGELFNVVADATLPRMVWPGRPVDGQPTSKTLSSPRALVPGSSHISSIWYHRKSQILIVEFNDGSLYEYPNVNSELIEKWLSAPSIGEYFSANIRERANSRLSDKAVVNLMKASDEPVFTVDEDDLATRTPQAEPPASRKATPPKVSDEAKAKAKAKAANGSTRKLTEPASKTEAEVEQTRAEVINTVAIGEDNGCFAEVPEGDPIESYAEALARAIQDCELLEIPQKHAALPARHPVEMAGFLKELDIEVVFESTPPDMVWVGNLVDEEVS